MKKKIYLGLMSVIFTTFLFVGFGDSAEAFVNLKEATKICEIFPDPAFAKYIADQLKKSPNEVVTQAELDKITYVNINSKGVKSIEGIKYMHNNQAFHFSSNEVTDLSPLRGWENHKLNNLQLYNNHNITDISPLLETKLPNLWILFLHNLNLDNSAFDVLAKFNTAPKMGTLQLAGNHLDDFNKLTKMPHKNALWLGIYYDRQTVELPAVTVGKSPLVIENTSTDLMDKVQKMPIINVSDNGLTDGDNSVTWNEEEIDEDTDYLTMNVESAANPDYTNYGKPNVEYKLPLKWQPVIYCSDPLPPTKVGNIFDPYAGVSAEDKEDGDLKVTVKESTVPVDGGVITKKGKFTVTYSVTDSDGNEVEKTVQVKVRA